MQFNVLDTSPQFPSSVEGIMLPDNAGEPYYLYDAMNPYIETDTAVMPFFVCEDAAAWATQYLSEHAADTNIQALVTFGRKRDLERWPDDVKSHFGVICKELAIDFLLLAVPDEYRGKTHSWAYSNPLSELFQKHTTVHYDKKGQHVDIF